MTCDVAYDRILSHPAGVRPDADLKAHLATCSTCTSVTANVRVVDQLVANLSVADSTPRKAAFLASLRMGTTVRPRSSPLKGLTRNPTVRTLLALAAAVLIAATAFSLWPRGEKTSIEFAYVKHELLQHSLHFACEQGNRSSPAKRLESAAEYAGHLLAGVRGVYLAASPDDIDAVNAISDLFATTLRQGITDSATEVELPNAIDRKAALDPLMPMLAGYAQTARELAMTAPEHVKPILKRLETAAVACAHSLETQGATAASPKHSPVAAGLDAGRELRATKMNRAVIEVLAHRGLKAGAAADAVDRANEVREASAAVETALARAVGEGDAERAGEWGESLAIMLSQGVKPAVDRASEGGDNPASPSYDRVRELKAKLMGDAERAKAALPTTGRLADHPRVKAAQKKLNEAVERIL